MPVSDDQKLAMWREVLQLCRVKPGQNIAVLTGETSLTANIDMAMRASRRSAHAFAGSTCRPATPAGHSATAPMSASRRSRTPASRPHSRGSRDLRSIIPVPVSNLIRWDYEFRAPA